MSRDPKKVKTVLFFLPDLSGGGAQRTVLNIVNHLDRGKLRPVLAMLVAEGPYMEALKGDVPVVELGALRIRSSIYKLAKCIRRIRPDIVFSTLIYPNAGLILSAILSATKVPIVLRETNHPTASGRKMGTFSDQAIGWAYRRSDRVVALSKGVRKNLIERYALKPERVVTIYNPVDIEHIQRLSREEPEGCPWDNTRDRKLFEILAVGKLHRQKGFDLLIQALTSLDDRPCRLTILGEGPEKEALKNQARKLGIGDRLFMPGFKKNPYSWMARADLLVLSSRWEGFGHVIAESMACGTAVLSTQCFSGPDEIIAHGVNGLLCKANSASELKDAILFLVENPEKRKAYALAARQSVKRFDTKVIIKEYEELFVAY